MSRGESHFYVRRNKGTLPANRALADECRPASDLRRESTTTKDATKRTARNQNGQRMNVELRRALQTQKGYRTFRRLEPRFDAAELALLNISVGFRSGKTESLCSALRSI